MDAKRLDVSTSKTWLWGRLRVIEGEDMAAVADLQKQFALVPLSGKSHTGETLPPLPQIGDDEFGFFTHLAAALKDNPVKPQDAALYGQLSRIGLTDAGFDPSKLPGATRKGMAAGLKDGPSVAYASLTSNAVVRNGWTWATSLDNFGYKYPLRAMVAGPYLGGQGEKEAMYPTRSDDSDGKALDGSSGNVYQIKLSSPPPVDAFWSLAIYKATDKLLVDNPIDRYKIGPTTKGFRTAPDGSITIVISHDRPTDENASNWLPAPDAVQPIPAVVPTYRANSGRQMAIATGRQDQVSAAMEALVETRAARCRIVLASEAGSLRPDCFSSSCSPHRRRRRAALCHAWGGDNLSRATAPRVVPAWFRCGPSWSPRSAISWRYRGGWVRDGVLLSVGWA